MNGPLRRATLAALFALFALSSAPAFSQDQPAAPAPEKSVPSWTVTCTSTGGAADLACSISQVIIVKESGQRVLTVTVGKEAGKLTLRLSLPHGIDLPKGVDIWVDEGKRQTHPIVTADQKGSYAIIGLDDGFIGALKQGTDLNVAVTAYAGAEIVLKVSLTGFSAAFAKL